MKRNNITYKKGFTLIELLVVVLIIGILSAVALPQYQKAMDKAQVSKMLPVLKDMAEANELYYLENGSYTRNAAHLSIELPADCTYNGTAGKTGQIWACGTDFMYDNSTHDVIIRYCPGSNSTYDKCSANRLISLSINHQHALPEDRVPEEWLCGYRGTAAENPRGYQLCKTFPFRVAE